MSGKVVVNRSISLDGFHQEKAVTAETTMAPMHPGGILLEEFLKPLGLSQYQLAKEQNVPARRTNEIVRGQRRVAVDTALRLARFFATCGRDSG